MSLPFILFICLYIYQLNWVEFCCVVFCALEASLYIYLISRVLRRAFPERKRIIVYLQNIYSFIVLFLRLLLFIFIYWLLTHPALKYPLPIHKQWTDVDAGEGKFTYMTVYFYFIHITLWYWIGVSNVLVLCHPRC